MRERMRRIFEAANPEQDVSRRPFRTIPGEDLSTQVYHHNGQRTLLRRFTPKTVQNLLSHAWELKLPCAIFGLPGIGKSQIIKKWANTVFTGVDPRLGLNGKTFSQRQFIAYDQHQAGKLGAAVDPETGKRITMKEVTQNPEKYFVVYDIRASQISGDEIAGIPNTFRSQREGKGAVLYDKPFWVVWLSHPESAGVLFLDEVNRGNLDVMNSFLGIMQEGIVGEAMVSSDIMIVCAANTGALFADETHDIGFAFMNRCHSGVLEVNAEEWLQYAEAEGVHPDILGYVRSDPEKTLMVTSEQLAKVQDESDIYKGSPPPFPTPRSIVNLSRQIKAIQAAYDRAEKAGKQLDTSEFYEVIGAARSLCGGEWAEGFEQYLRQLMEVPLKLDQLASSDFKKYNLSQISAIIEHCINMSVFLFEEVYTNNNKKYEKGLEDLLIVIGKLPADCIAKLTNRIYHSAPNDLLRTFVKNGALSPNIKSKEAYGKIATIMKSINESEQEQKRQDAN